MTAPKSENPRVAGSIPALGTTEIKASRVFREAFFVPNQSISSQDIGNNFINVLILLTFCNKKSPRFCEFVRA